MYGKSVSDLTKVVQKRTRDAIYKKMHNLRKNGTDYSGKPIPEVVLEILNDRINHQDVLDIEEEQKILEAYLICEGEHDLICSEIPDVDRESVDRFIASLNFVLDIEQE